MTAGNPPLELGRNAVPALRLRFADADREAAFRRDYARTVLLQSRVALASGAVAYGVLGLEDPWFFPERFAAVWALRLAIITLIALSFALTFTRAWQRHNQGMLAATGLVAGAGPLLMIAFGGPAVANSYYFGLALVIVWLHTFSGLRMAPAFGISAAFIVTFTLTVAGIDAVPLRQMATNTLNLCAALTIAGLAGYLIERQRRVMFWQTTLLDAERRSHQRLALHDHLTGLPNRVHFEASMRTALGRARRSGRRLAVLFVDLDGFKAVNDAYGHGAGDRVLATIARALKGAVRQSDTVTRLGGDEFLVLLEDLDQDEDAEGIAEAILEALRTPVSFRHQGERMATVTVTGSIGVALSDGSEEPEAIIHRADGAMYAAKRNGRDTRREDRPSRR